MDIPGDHGHDHGPGVFFPNSRNISISGGNFVYNSEVQQSEESLMQQALELLNSHTSDDDDHLLHKFKGHPAISRSHSDGNLLSQGIVERVRRSQEFLYQKDLYKFFNNQYSRLIALSVACHLDEEKLLLATLIMPDRHHGQLNIVRTLAYQMVKSIPSTAPYVLKSCREDPKLFNYNTEEQLKRLVLFPLKHAAFNASAAEKLQWPSVVVIDGTTTRLNRNDIQIIIQSLKSFGSDPVSGIRISLVVLRSIGFTHAANNVLIAVYHNNLSALEAMYYFVLSTNHAVVVCYFKWRVHAQELETWTTYIASLGPPTSDELSEAGGPREAMK